jgi:hypothetical protein
MIDEKQSEDVILNGIEALKLMYVFESIEKLNNLKNTTQSEIIKIRCEEIITELNNTQSLQPYNSNSYIRKRRNK